MKIQSQLSPDSAPDLFENLDQLPDPVLAIIQDYSNESELAYQECKEFQLRLESIGYTFEYYLDAVPFNLRPIKS